MVVSEISNGSEVKIYASIDGHNIVLLTEAIFGVAAGLLVKPMEYFGKYMQFLEPSSVQIRNKRDGRVYKFMSTTITPVKTRYGNFHLIRCSSELEPENSRRAERFYIEKLGVFSINGNTAALKNCIIHDISLRGLSIIIDNDTKVKPGDRLDIMFRYGETLHNYEVNTIVVRNFMVKDMPWIWYHWLPASATKSILLSLIMFRRQILILRFPKNSRSMRLRKILQSSLFPKNQGPEQSRLPVLLIPPI